MIGHTEERDRTSVLLSDANILIDLANAGALGLVRDVINHDIASVYLPRIVYDEISSVITENQIADLGIIILPVEIELNFRVVQYPDRRLSAADKSLLLMAKDAGYTVWTNDGHLRKKCKDEGISAMWCFEVLRLLVDNDYLAAAELLAIAARVEETNPYLRGIADRLRSQLGIQQLKERNTYEDTEVGKK